jgi:sugar phosphate isomerase/epimerase
MITSSPMPPKERTHSLEKKRTNRLTTKTGKFPIGFRRVGYADWQKDPITTIRWARDNHFSAIDLLREGADAARSALQSDLKIGSVDLLEWPGMISPDASKWKDTIQKNIEYIKGFAGIDNLNFFTVMLPEKPDLSRDENFRYMVESYRILAPVLESQNARLVIEGWPGPGVLCCTPETVRAFFKECPSPAFGINYDPSHLIRMGIDPLRFLREFVNRVYHVHGKDTQLLDEGLYEYGNSQPSTFAKKARFSGPHWRYTLAGNGGTDWPAVFKILKESQYQGCISIELEDMNYFETPELQQEGLLKAAKYLSNC